MSNVNDPARASEGPPPKDATNMAMLAYVLGIFFPLLGPLLIWLMKKDENAFIADQSKEALNWGITMGICYVVCAILTAVVIGAFLLPIVAIVHVVFSIMGAMKANQGIRYRFPFALRLVK